MIMFYVLQRCGRQYKGSEGVSSPHLLNYLPLFVDIFLMLYEMYKLKIFLINI